MPNMSPHAERSTAGAERSPVVPVRAVVVLAAAVAAAWIAAGSTGLLAHSLRHALCWVALAVAIVAGWPRRDESLVGWFGLAVAAVLGLTMTASTLPVVNVLAVTVVTAALVRSPASLRGRVILIATLATAVLAVFRLASTSTAAVWLAADAFGRALGSVAGRITGEPLWVGATFGGVDFLVLMAAVYVGWLISTAPPRLPRAIYAAAAILLGHVIYLIVLAYATELRAALPDPVLPDMSDPGTNRVGVWAWGNAVRTLLPWNLPLLAAVIHTAIAVVMFRWARWLPVAHPESDRAPRDPMQAEAVAWPIHSALRFGPPLLAVCIPLLTVVGLSTSTLEKKTEDKTEPKRIVAYDQGYLDWNKPEHDSETAGTYGVLELFVESLGGELIKSADLSDEHLDKADAVLLLHPNRPWPQDRLQRLRQYVRDDGGSLLVVAEPKILEITPEGISESTFNEVLEPANKWNPAMEVRDDTAIAAAGNWEWEHCLETLAHPTTAGIDDRRNRFGLGMGSSIRLRWPARPILVGRYAFSEPGSDAVSTYQFQYDSGDKLGDLVLAAEQRLGRGRIVVLGDATSLNNDVIADSYVFAGRLLGYLAGDARSPQAWWRQLPGLAAMAVLVGLLAWRTNALRVAVTALVLAGVLTGCVALGHWVARVLPDGRPQLPDKHNNLAYIDASHLEAYSTDTWHEFGVAGLARTMVRNGYLPLLLPKLTSERLQRAGLLISIAPARRFSDAERKTVREFVEAGGTLICMVGSEEVAARQELLEDFEFQVPPSPTPVGSETQEPVPLGSFPLNITREDSEVPLRTFAAWEVRCTAKDGWNAWALWSDEQGERPFIMSRRVERGHVAVIGDTYFATNQNLESAVNVIPENITFWRWFLTCVTDREEWLPQKPDRETEPPEEPPAEDPPNDDTASDEGAP